MKNKLGHCCELRRLAQRALRARAKRSTATREVRANSNGKRDPIVNSISSAFSEVDLRFASSISAAVPDGIPLFVQEMTKADWRRARKLRASGCYKGRLLPSQQAATILVDAGAYCTRAGLISSRASLGKRGTAVAGGFAAGQSQEQLTRVLDQIAALPATLALCRERIKLQVPS